MGLFFGADLREAEDAWLNPPAEGEPVECRPCEGRGVENGDPTSPYDCSTCHGQGIVHHDTAERLGWLEGVERE